MIVIYSCGCGGEQLIVIFEVVLVSISELLGEILALCDKRVINGVDSHENM